MKNFNAQMKIQQMIEWALPKTIYEKKAQMKIQQMTFMILAVFLLFVFVGLFFINWQFKDVKKSYEELTKDEAISSLGVISNMPELNCDSTRRLCIDEDKLLIMSSDFGKDYESFWSVSSIKVYKIYPAFDAIVRCPAKNCNYFEVFNNEQKDSREFSTYVDLCKKLSENDFIYERCEIAKLAVGMKINEE